MGFLPGPFRLELNFAAVEEEVLPDADTEGGAERVAPFVEGFLVKAFGDEGDEAKHFGGYAGDNAGRLRRLARAGT